MIRQFIRKLSSGSENGGLEKRKSGDLESTVPSLQVQREEFLKNWENPPRNGANLEDFVRVRTIGTGSFGRVLLVRHTPTGNYNALKALEKRQVVRMKQVEHTICERKILACINFPFIVQLLYSFRDFGNVYMVMEYVNGGEIFRHLRNKGRFEENLTKFYSIQVVLIIEYLHNLDIVYRDLKPENMLLSADGYVKLTDFGFAKRIVKTRTYTLCGTPEYLAPEIILGKGYSDAVDWWALGVLIFEMICGYPPFYADAPINIYEKIVAGKVAYPVYVNPDLKDLLRGFLKVDATARLGNYRHGTRNVKGHKWFTGVDWIAYLEKRITPPYQPVINEADMGDASNFDAYAEEELLQADHDEFSRLFAEF